MPPRRPPILPPFHDILDELVDAAVNTASDAFKEYAASLHKQATSTSPPPHKRARTRRPAPRHSNPTPRPPASPRSPKPSPHPLPPTHYDVLGVAPTAPLPVISAAYKALSRMYHPDLHGNSTGELKEKAGKEMLKVNAAYEVLGDVRKRTAYDAELRRRGRI